VISSTDRYVDPWGRRAFLAPLVALVLAFVAITQGEVAWTGSLYVREGEPFRATPPFQLPANWKGGVRIAGEVSLPVNMWAALQVRLVDQQGNVLLDLGKEVWWESGRWREGGETGSYTESDTSFEWPARLGQAEKVHLEATVLDMGDNVAEYGTVLDPSVPYDRAQPPVVAIALQVHTQTADLTLALLAVLLSGGLAILALYRAGHGGTPVFVDAQQSHFIETPAVELGGFRRLVTVAVSGATGANDSEQVVVVRLHDEAGRLLHKSRDSATTWKLSDSARRRYWLHVHFELPTRGRYSLRVETSPPRATNFMKVLVRDGNTTRGSVDVTQVQPREHA
jgi:hypothetical protein